MLIEVSRERFWIKLPFKTERQKGGDVNIYVKEGQKIGYVNTFTRRYFLVEKEEEGDLEKVRQAQLVMDEQKEVVAKKTAARKKVDLGKKYPHAIMESLTLDPEKKKQKVRIRCGCGDTSRWVFTSDLFQVKICTACNQKLKDIQKQAKVMVEVDAETDLQKQARIMAKMDAVDQRNIKTDELLDFVEQANQPKVG